MIDTHNLKLKFKKKKFGGEEVIFFLEAISLQRVYDWFTLKPLQDLEEILLSRRAIIRSIVDIFQYIHNIDRETSWFFYI